MRTHPALAMAVALHLAAAAPAIAQASTTFGAQGGVFSGQTTRDARNTLDLTLSAEGAHDSDGSALRGIGGGPDTLVGGYSTLLLGGADYKLKHPRVQLGATGNGVWRRYTDQPDLRKGSYSAGLGFSAEPTRRTTLTANQSLAYAPSYLAGLFPSASEPAPGDSTPIAPNYTIHDSPSYSYGTSVGLSQGLSRRSELSIDAGLSITDYQDAGIGLPDLDSRNARVGYSHHLSKNLAGTIGYRYRNGTFGYAVANRGADMRTTEQGVDLGLDYTRPLSATRSLNVGFTIGGSRMKVPLVEPGSSQTAAGDDLVALLTDADLNRVAGSGSISWQFASTWSVSGAAKRGAEFIATLGAPVYVDSVSAALSGLLSSRVGVSVGGGYSSGQSALNQNALVFDTYSGDARVQVALSQKLAAYGQFFYYYYAFDQDSRAPLGIPRGLERTGVHIGVTCWVPAFRR